MTRLTCMMFDDPSVNYFTTELDGKYGIVIEADDLAPSGFERKRILLEIEPCFEYAMDAEDNADKIIEICRTANRYVREPIEDRKKKR